MWSITCAQIVRPLFMHHYRGACILGDRPGTRPKNFGQFLCLAFAQLTYRESLRDIEACLRSVGNKLYHLNYA
jgi:hypothetical protein